MSLTSQAFLPVIDRLTNGLVKKKYRIPISIRTSWRRGSSPRRWPTSERARTGPPWRLPGPTSTPIPLSWCPLPPWSTLKCHYPGFFSINLDFLSFSFHFSPSEDLFCCLMPFLPTSFLYATLHQAEMTPNLENSHTPVQSALCSDAASDSQSRESVHLIEVIFGFCNCLVPKPFWEQNDPILSTAPT